MRLPPVFASRRAVLLAAVTVALLAPARPAAAQVQQLKTVGTSGVFSLFRGHAVNLHLVDTGPRTGTATSYVVLKVFNDLGVQLRKVEGPVLPGQPLRLTFRHSELPGNPDAVPVRAEARVTTASTNTLTAPIMTFEMYDEADLGLTIGVSCPLAGPGQGSTGKTLSCECHVVTEPVAP